MSIFGSQIMDFFGVGHKRNTSDDAFLDIVKSHPDILKEAYLSNCIVCCPVSASLGNEIVPKEHVMSHVLVPGRIPGEFISLSGQHVHISGNYLICGVGYKEARKVKIVNVSQLTDWGKTISIYYIHRPLVGGVNAPEEIGEMSTAQMLKYVATLKSFPDAKQSFANLDDYIREMKVLGRMSSLDGFNKIRPTLSVALRTQWQRACERMVRSETIVAHLGGGDVEKAKQHIYQVIESYIMHSMVEFVYPWLCRRVDHGETSIHNLMEGIHLCSQSDLGVSPEFQTNQSDAIRELCSIVDAPTPAEKMLVFTKVINLIREAIDLVVSKKFPSTEVEFATDDLVCVLIWVIIQAYPYYRLIVVDLLYCKEFHFCNSSRTQLGYNMCHIEVAVSWFTKRANQRRRPSDTIYSSTALLSVQTIEESDNEALKEDAPTVEGDAGGASSSTTDTSAGPPETVESVVRKLSSAEEDDLMPVAPPAVVPPAQQVDSSLKTIDEPTIANLQASQPQHHSHHPATANIDAWPSLLVPDNLRANLLWAKHQSQWDSEMSGVGQSLFTNSKESLGSSEELGISTDKNSSESVEALVEAASSVVEHTKPPPPIVADTRLVSDATQGRYFAVLDVYNRHRSKNCAEMQCILSEDTNKPDPIALTSGFGDYFAALTVSGNPYTWGQPDCGRLGRGVTQELDFFFPVKTPTPVSGLASCGKINQLACGKGHMLAVTENGEMYVWGDNRCGQLGLFDMTVKSSNRNSGKLAAVAELAVFSELAMVQATSPTLLEAMTHIKVTAVACGAHHSLCLGVDGNVYSWGRAANGRLGQLSEKSHTAEHLMGRPAAVRSKWQPSAPLTLAELNSLRPSWSESASFGGRAISMSPSMSNLQGGGTSAAHPMSPISNRSLSPSAQVPPPTASRVTLIAAGFNYSVAVTSCGAVYTWGCGTYGALGHGSHCDEYLPRQVMSLRFPGARIVSVSASHHTLFLASNGLLYGCGLNNKKQVQALPEVSSRYSESKIDSISALVARPIEIPSCFSSSGESHGEDRLNNSGFSSGSNAVTRVKGMSCGDFHTAVLTVDNRLLVWGDVELSGKRSTADDSETSMRDISHLIPGDKQIKQAYCSGETITVLAD